jgi:hypothetical protein
MNIDTIKTIFETAKNGDIFLLDGDEAMKVDHQITGHKKDILSIASELARDNPDMTCVARGNQLDGSQVFAVVKRVKGSDGHAGRFGELANILAGDVTKEETGVRLVRHSTNRHTLMWLTNHEDMPKSHPIVS